LAQDSRQASTSEIVERAQRALTLLNNSEPFRIRPPYDDDDDEYDEEGECNCPACRAEREERALGKCEELDELDEEDDDEEDGEFGDLPRAAREELIATMARFADQMPPEVLDMFRQMAEDGPEIPPPEFLKKKRPQTSDGESRRRN
jgi:hypothetical protein